MSADSSDPASVGGVKSQSKFRYRLRPGKQKSPKNFGSPWRVILSTLVFFIVSQFLALFILEAALSLTHKTGDINSLLDQSAPLQFFYILLAEGLAVLLVLWLLKVRGLGLAAIGWGRKPAWRDLTRGLVGFAVFFLLLIVVTAILTAIFPSLKDNQQQDVGFSNLSTSLDAILAFIALVFLPPIGEETLVRGYLYSGLRASWRFLPAMLVTSLLFGLAHLQSGSGGTIIWGAAIDTFLLSLVLVYLREHTGALYAGILVHSLNNLIAFSTHFHGLVF